MATLIFETVVRATVFSRAVFQTTFFRRSNFWLAVRFLTSALPLITPAIAQAEIEVAFIEMKTPDGKAIELEPGDKFAHLGIAFDGGWIHVHPFRGVEWVPRLNIMGEVKEILTAPQLPDLSFEQIKPWLGKPYDHSFIWENRHATYCSKLIATLLEIPPEPMTFKSDYWKTYGGGKTYPEGAPGISPDKIYRSLKKRGFLSITPTQNRQYGAAGCGGVLTI